jgi:hypothetical protein
MVASPMPPLPRRVVPPSDFALPVALLGGLADLASPLRRAALGAVQVAPRSQREQTTTQALQQAQANTR